MARKKGTITAQTKSNILNSAADIFAKYGYAHSSLKAISDNAQVTTGAIYFFFDSKEDIFYHCLKPFFDEIEKILNYRREQVDDLGYLREDIDYQTTKAIINLEKDYPKQVKIVCREDNQKVVNQQFHKLLDFFKTETLTFLAKNNIPISSFSLSLLADIRVYAIKKVLISPLTLAEKEKEAELLVKSSRGAMLEIRRKENA